MSGSERRLISDIASGKPMARRPQRAGARTYARRNYQSGRLVDVVYVRRHQPKQQPAISPPKKQEPHRYAAVRTPVPTRTSWLDTGRLLPAVVAGLILVAGTAVLIMTVATNRRVVEQVAAESQLSAGYDGQAAEGSPPGEDEVDERALQDYTVEARLPRLLEIEKLDVKSRIRRMGTLASGAVAVPANIYDTGWYEGSSRPGEGGAVLLVGHINGPSKPGVFAGLKELRAGDIISLLRGDGQRFTYKVVSKEQVPAEKVDMKKALVAITPGKGGLNLMTCAGMPINGGAEYTDRIIVYTEQL